MQTVDGTRIIEGIEAIGKRVDEHLEAYGVGYEMRLTGHHETCRFDEFKYGVSDRTASIRIPAQVASDRCGYLKTVDRMQRDSTCGYPCDSRKRLQPLLRFSPKNQPDGHCSQTLVPSWLYCAIHGTWT